MATNHVTQTEVTQVRIAFVLPAITAVLIGLVTVSGCGGVTDAPPSVPIKGKVTYKGQPITSGEVVYTPSKEADGAASGRTARGIIQKDGTFQMRTSPSVPGVVPGDYTIYLVSVDATTNVQAGPSSAPVERPSADRQPKLRQASIPEKYLSPATSGLSETVDETHSGTTDIVLTD